MKQRSPAYSITQFIVSFVIPLIILVRFSSESQLGATGGFLLALLFPLAFEAYGIARYRKISVFSLIAIGGILLTGLFGIFELSENWLAVRRSAIYFLAAFVLVVSVWINRPVIKVLLPHILDMALIEQAAKKNKNAEKLARIITLASYLLGILLLVIAIVTVIVTKVVITSPSGSQLFNDQYAHLRVLSLPFITLPFLVGIIVVVTFVIGRIEKLTGLEADKLLKNHRRTVSPKTKK